MDMIGVYLGDAAGNFFAVQTAINVMFLLHFGPDVKVPSHQTLCEHVRNYFEQKYMSLYRFDIETDACFRIPRRTSHPAVMPSR